ncbi:MAG: SRPBCC family protein [Bacteroidetes bacterium]|nr:SRPBCC family protein [Bacteroidota bacterium]
MSTLNNEIIIKAPLEKVWDLLADATQLGKYDPTIKSCTLISKQQTGIDAKRKIDMLDGKNWFEEKITVCEPNKALAYQLTACSFPIKRLQHTYTFENMGNGNTKVKQVMEYSVKFGILGKLMDAMMIKKQFNTGIGKFFAGLKTYAETKS